MNENVTNALEDINNSELIHGKDSLHVIEEEEKNAVVNGNKTTDEIERIMSADEILFAASNNPIYVNMVLPCLAANISINDRIFKYFEEPVAPVELNDKLMAVMLVVVAEVSKENNGIVFFDDGSLDFKGSLEQCAMMGTQPISFLSSSMSDAELLRYKTQMENETSRLGILQSAGTSNYSKNIIEEVFGKSLANMEKARNIPDYAKFAGKVNLTPEEKNKVKTRKDEIDQELENNKRIVQVLAEERKKYPIGSPEYNSYTEQMHDIALKKHGLYKERALLGNPENDSLEEISAKGLVTKMYIFGAIGVPREVLLELGAISRDIRQNGSKLEKEALENETYSRILQKNVIDKVVKDDGETLKDLKDKNSRGELTQESKDEFLVKALKTYVTFNNLTGKLGMNIFDRESSASLVRYAKECITDLVPELMTESGNLDYDKLAEYVQKIPGYDKVTMDNFTAILITEKAQEIGEIVEEIEKSGEIELLRAKEQEAMEFVDGLSEEAKEDTLVNGYNVIKAFSDMGVESKLPKILKAKLEKNNFGHVVKNAELKYKETKPFLEEQISRHRASYFEDKFKAFNVYSRYQRTKFSNEEIYSYLSAAISAYDNTREGKEQDGNLRENALKIIKIYLPDSLDKNGNVDENKLLEEYKKYVSDGKYSLMPKDETVDGMFKYHNIRTLEKIQGDILRSYIASVERIKQNDKLITNEEARGAVERNGEQLDASGTQVKNEGKNQEIIDPIPDVEAKKAVEKDGVEMRVDNPNERSTETKPLDSSINKKVEEQGNFQTNGTTDSGGDSAASNNINSSLVPVNNERTDKKGLIGIITNVFNKIKGFMDKSKNKKEKEEIDMSGDVQEFENSGNEEQEKDDESFVAKAVLNYGAAQVTNPKGKETSVEEYEKD